MLVVKMTCHCLYGFLVHFGGLPKQKGCIGITKNKKRINKYSINPLCSGDLLVGDLHKIGNICLNQSNCVPSDTFVEGFLIPLFSKNEISTAVAPATAKFTPLIEFWPLDMLFTTPTYGGTSGNPIPSASKQNHKFQKSFFYKFEKIVLHKLRHLRTYACFTEEGSNHYSCVRR